MCRKPKTRHPPLKVQKEDDFDHFIGTLAAQDDSDGAFTSDHASPRLCIQRPVQDSICNEQPLNVAGLASFVFHRYPCHRYMRVVELSSFTLG